MNEDDAANLIGERGHLRRYKYTYGWARDWIQADGAQVSVHLLRFEGAKNAAYFLRDIFDPAVLDDDLATTAVQNVPGGRSLLVDVDGAYTAISAAAAGDLVVYIMVTGEEKTTVNAAESMLADQYKRL